MGFSLIIATFVCPFGDDYILRKCFAFVLGAEIWKISIETRLADTHRLLWLYPFFDIPGEWELLVCFEVSRAEHQISVRLPLLFYNVDDA